jgi:hypothetical protein
MIKEEANGEYKLFVIDKDGNQSEIAIATNIEIDVDRTLIAPMALNFGKILRTFTGKIRLKFQEGYLNSGFFRSCLYGKNKEKRRCKQIERARAIMRWGRLGKVNH